MAKNVGIWLAREETDVFRFKFSTVDGKVSGRVSLSPDQSQSAGQKMEAAHAKVQRLAEAFYKAAKDYDYELAPVDNPTDQRS